MTSLMLPLDHTAQAIPRAELVTLREGWETPPSGVWPLLDVELFTPRVWDPCCGLGSLAETLRRSGYDMGATDIEDWGYTGGTGGIDFLETTELLAPCVVMNPPFSLACEFVVHALRLGARKVAAFQRLAWWESDGRASAFWPKYRPQRIYGFDLKITCWRFDVPPQDRDGGTPVAHAWFVWEPGQPAGPLLGHLRVRR